MVQTREPASMSLSVPPSDTAFTPEPEPPAGDSVELHEYAAGEVPDVAAPLVAHCDPEQHVLSLSVDAAAWLELPGPAAAGRPLAALLGEVAYRTLQPCVTEALHGAIADAD